MRSGTMGIGQLATGSYLPNPKVIKRVTLIQQKWCRASCPTIFAFGVLHLKTAPDYYIVLIEQIGIRRLLAEREGFEPSEPLRVH